MALLWGITPSAGESKSVSDNLASNWGPIGAVCPELPNNVVTFIEGFEVKAHFEAQQASRSLDLIRRSWGWYINNPYGTESTIVEGYLADGTFGYRATTGYNGDYSFTSHSHGWSTGPVAALSTYVVGISLTAPAGSKWNLSPQFGDLTSAEGGLTTPLGGFSSGWQLTDAGYNLWYKSPSGTEGTIIVPSSSDQVTLDGVATTGAYDSGSKMVTLTVQGDGSKHNIVIAL